MEKEIWKDITNYEGLYQVSNLGRVRSLDRNVEFKNGVIRNYKGKILKNLLNKTGYYAVNLYKNDNFNIKIHKYVKIHQLVAEVFLNHIKNGMKYVIDHKDNNPLNNRLDNLQIITHRYNLSKDKTDKTSKYTGVYWCKIKKKFISRIYFNGKQHILGRFNDEYSAHIAYQNKLKEVEERRSIRSNDTFLNKNLLQNYNIIYERNYYI